MLCILGFDSHAVTRISFTVSQEGWCHRGSLCAPTNRPSLSRLGTRTLHRPQCLFQRLHVGVVVPAQPLPLSCPAREAGYL